MAYLDNFATPPEPLPPGKFRCAMCHGVFDEGRSEEEALAEKEVYFPGVSVEDCAVVCDTCWIKIHPQRN